MQLFSNSDYFKIDIANNFGLDKKNWDERIAWFEENKENLIDIKDEADEPAQYLKAVYAYVDAIKTNMTKHIMRLDGTASGYQCISALFNDITLMKNCNLLDTGKRMCAYTVVSSRMQNLLNNPDLVIKRSDAKSACMKGGYGSIKAPVEAFGEGEELDAFYEAVNLEAPSSAIFNAMCLDLWNPKALEYNWVMPDLFHVKQVVEDKIHEPYVFMGQKQYSSRYINKPVRRGRSLGANFTHSVDSLTIRELVRICSYNPKLIQRTIDSLKYNGKRNSTEDDRLVIELTEIGYRQGYLSFRILEHICPENVGHVDKAQILEMLAMLPPRPFPVSLIHDCIGSYVFNMNKVRKVYNYLMFKLAQSDLLNDWIYQITGRIMPIEKYDSSMNHKILEANYALS